MITKAGDGHILDCSLPINDDESCLTKENTESTRLEGGLLASS